MTIAGPRLGGLSKFDTWPGGGGNNGILSITDKLAMVRVYLQGQKFQDRVDAEIFSKVSLSDN